MAIPAELPAARAPAGAAALSRGGGTVGGRDFRGLRPRAPARRTSSAHRARGADLSGDGAVPDQRPERRALSGADRGWAPEPGTEANGLGALLGPARLQ